VTIRISRKAVGVTSVLLGLGALIAIGFYAYGVSTRMPDNAVVDLVNTRVDRAVTTRGEQAGREQTAAVSGAEAAQRTRDNKRWRKRMNKAVKKSRQAGYESGQAAGYSSGNAAGFSSGKSAGVEEGITKASDELVCSDDLDVDLPPCFDY
jgi:hypothetical protein